LSARARLVWARPDGQAIEFPLEGEESFEVGRDEEVALRVDEPLVSRRHARLELRQGVWHVVDLDSTNFTRVNGLRIRRPQELADGDLLVFGRARCTFRLEGE
jgi:pSer/pThr/pTyr-binding forkhead associated (FHA) protein